MKAASRSELMELTKVNDALDQAEAQIVAYRAALARSRGEMQQRLPVPLLKRPA